MRIDSLDIVDTIVDGGKTHVAINGDYAGQIDTYNNFVTKFIAWLAGARTITINGEKIYASSKSLEAFMSKNVEDFRSLDMLNPYRDLNTYSFRVLPQFGKDRFMSAHISAYTRDILSRDLFKAIATGKEGLAMKKVRQGAELDTHAWFNETSGEFFFKQYFGPSLPAMALEPQRFTQATPFLLAQRLHQVGVAALIREHEADLSKVGQTLVFIRDKADSKTDWQLIPKIRNEVIEEEFEDSNGEIKKKQTVVKRIGLDLETSETHYFVDRYEKRDLMTFNTHTDEIDYTSQPSHYFQWDTNYKTANIPLY